MTDTPAWQTWLPALAGAGIGGAAGAYLGGDVTSALAGAGLGAGTALVGEHVAYPWLRDRAYPWLTGQAPQSSKFNWKYDETQGRWINLQTDHYAGPYQTQLLNEYRPLHERRMELHRSKQWTPAHQKEWETIAVPLMKKIEYGRPMPKQANLAVEGWLDGYFEMMKVAYGTGSGPQLASMLGPGHQQNQAYVPNMNNSLLGQTGDMSRTSAPGGGVGGGLQMYPGAAPTSAGAPQQQNASSDYKPFRGGTGAYKPQG